MGQFSLHVIVTLPHFLIPSCCGYRIPPFAIYGCNWPCQAAKKHQVDVEKRREQVKAGKFYPETGKDTLFHLQGRLQTLAGLITAAPDASVEEKLDADARRRKGAQARYDWPSQRTTRPVMSICLYLVEQH